MDRLCERCGTKLMLGSVDYLEEGKEYRYYCPHCGMVVELYYDREDDKKDVYISLKGKIESPYEHYCYNCGEKLNVSANECLSDTYDIDPGSDNDKMSIVFHDCENCGCSQTIWDVSETEKQIFEYWGVPSLEYDVVNAIYKSYAEHMKVELDLNKIPIYKRACDTERERCRNDYLYWREKHCPYILK